MTFLYTFLPWNPREYQTDLPACHLSGNYSCDQGNKYPDCYNPLGLDFNTTQIITSLINCSYDWRVFKQNGKPNQDGLLNGAACHQLAGDSYTTYPGLDIIDRLTNWKLPLLQLVSLTPRPPLGKSVSYLVLVRMLGNPGGTIQNYHIKIASCHARAKFWQAQFGEHGALHDLVGETHDDNAHKNNPPTLKHHVKTEWHRFKRHERLWKALAVIIDSYDEWGRALGDQMQNILLERLTSLVDDEALPRPEKERILNIYLSTAQALAADRTTQLLPVYSAITLFCISVGLSTFKTWAAGSHSPGFYLNIEAYSIGFSALYFWIFTAETLAVSLGSSDSEDRIPRILNRFKSDLGRGTGSELRRFHLHEDNSYEVQEANMANDRRDMDTDRRTRGGIYSWQPLMWKNSSQLTALRKEFPGKTFFHRHFMAPGSALLTWCIITTGAVCAAWICWKVPPDGFNCRHHWVLTIYGIWILSWTLDHSGLNASPDENEESPHNNSPNHYGKSQEEKIAQYEELFLYHTIKDTLACAATVACVLATQTGILNKCNCYTFASGQATPLELPQLSPAAEILEYRFKALYRLLVLGAILMNLLIYPWLIRWAYREGFRVFVQRDDGNSNYKELQARRFWRYAKRRPDGHHFVRQSTRNLESGTNPPAPTGWSEGFWRLLEGIVVFLYGLAIFLKGMSIALGAFFINILIILFDKVALGISALIRTPDSH